MKPTQYMTEKFMNILKSSPDVINLRNYSPNAYKTVLKMGLYLQEESMLEIMRGFQNGFIDRFLRLVLDMADSTEITKSDQFASDIKKLDNIERELFDLHRKTKFNFIQHKNRIRSRQIEVNFDLMDSDMKQMSKRLRM
mmetsp:Transcript_6663/g.10711  ORF Transcript_6663/g.10711 Transcript_6663/m.10711 type:complete len:139 (-) Transcript_6663:34-450(-)